MTAALLPSTCVAEEPAPLPLTLTQAVDYALAHHPRLDAQLAREELGVAGVERARAAYIPQADLSQMLDRAAEAHNPPGIYLPMPGYPISEGPRLNGNFGPSAWNSATSIFVDENLSGLLAQMKQVDAALAERELAAQGMAAERLLVAYGAADAFLAQAAAVETVRVTRAGVARAQSVATAIQGLVGSGMRSAADQSRALAELALAQNQEIAAERDRDLAQAALADALGIESQREITISGAQSYERVPQIPNLAATEVANPLLLESRASIKSSQYREAASRYEYLPRLHVIAGLFGRGTGLDFHGTVPGPGGGALPNSFNWAAGVTFTIPIQQLFAARGEVDAAGANVRLAEAQYGETALQVNRELRSARALLASAEKTAANMPPELAAAHSTWDQNNARYRAGLMTVVDVADAERLLTQAEVDDAVARVNVWRAMLLVSRAVGDLRPFFAVADNAAAGGHP